MAKHARTHQEKKAAPPQELGILTSLSSISFRWLWVGQSTSNLGDLVFAIALPFLVLEIDGRGSTIGQLFAVRSLPRLLFLPFGGVAVDRLPRRLVMIIIDLTRAAALAGVLVLFINSALNMSHLYATAALLSTASSFYAPATRSILPDLLAKDHLKSANSIRALSQQVAVTIGPLLGSLLISLGGLSLALAFDGVTFFVSAICLMLIPQRKKRQSASKGAKPNYFKEIAKGFKYVSNLNWLWITIVLFSLINVFVAGSVSVVFPLLAAERFGGADTFGWLLSAMAIGAIVASLTIGQIRHLRRRGIVAYISVIIAGFSLTGLAFAPSLPVGMISVALMGMGMTIFGIIWEILLQEIIPSQMLGRVSSTDMLGSLVLLPIGYLLLGNAASSVSLTHVILACGILTVSAASIGLTVPGIRKLG